MNDTERDTLRFIGRLNRDAITERNRADYWRRSTLWTWAVNAVLGGLLWWRW